MASLSRWKQMDPNISSATNKFNKLSSNYKDLSVACPRCNVPMVFKDLNNHMLANHRFHSKTACVYCSGLFVWKWGEAKRNLSVMEHRIQCLTNFVKAFNGDLESVSVVEMTKFEELPTECMETSADEEEWDDEPCACVEILRHDPEPPNMQGRKRLSGIDDSFYEPYGNQSLFYEMNDSRHVVFLESSGLGHYVYNVFRYFASGEYKFFHVMVRAKMWTKFATAPELGTLLSPRELHVLPYGCLCDGSHGFKKMDAKRRHHRHLLIMVDQRFVVKFKEQWKRLVNPKPDGRNKLCVWIKDEKHLMNAVWYVSNEKSSCNGSAEMISGARGSHYWIERRLYPHAKIAMATLWKEGHATLLSQMLKNQATHSFHEHVRFGNRVQLKYVKPEEHNCPIPLADGYALVDGEVQEDRPTVYMHGNLVQLERTEKAPSVMEEGWFDFQKSRKNVMWDRVLEEYYILGHNQVVMYNSAKRVEEVLKAKFADTLERETRKWDHVDKMNKNVIHELQMQNKGLLVQLSENQHMQSVHAMREQRMEKEREQFNEEKKQLQKRVDDTIERFIKLLQDNVVKSQAEKEEFCKLYGETIRMLQKHHEQVIKLKDDLNQVQNECVLEHVQRVERVIQMMLAMSAKWLSMNASEMKPEWK